MKRYRVESRNGKKHHFRADCTEEDLEYYKALCKYDASKNGGECYYREFPVTKNERVYYSKNNPEINVEDLRIIAKRVEESRRR